MPGADASATDSPVVMGQDTSTGVDVPTGGMMVPDPGAMMAGFESWRVPMGTNVSEPGRAHRVGVATVSPDYVEATTGANGNAFYVFRAGPALMSLRVNVFPPLDVPRGDFLHLHQGDGLVFGAEVMPTMSAAAGATWPVTPGSVYVLEFHLGAGVTF